ncbi:MAG: WD40 repeat domain-containing protein [Verrucomicrobia bacterium]|nr:WD40 repeat domain-containing protein [Verrucomicrobiota bacterium]
MSVKNNPIQPSTTSTITTTHSQATPPQSSGLVNLPSELSVKILKMLSIREFGSLNQTCHQISFVTTNTAPLNLLSHFFPNFRKTHPDQTDLEALKQEHITPSNLTKGVYVSHTLQSDYGYVTDLVLDGQRIVSCSEFGQITIWDLNTNACTATLKAHRGMVSRLALDGERLFSSSYDHTIKIWDLNTNTCTTTLQGHNGHVYSIALDEQRLFSSSYDHTIKIWDLNTNTCIATLQGHNDPVYSIALDGRRLVSCSWDSSIKIWDLNTNTCTTTLQGHNGRICSLKLDGQRLISGSYDNTIKIWDLKTNACIATLQGHSSNVESLALDGQRLFSGSNDKTIKIWDLNTNTCTATLQGHNGSVYSLALDGRRLVSASRDTTINIWDFYARDEDVFKEIASLLKSEDAAIAQNAMDRFDRMPPKAKNAIYQELLEILGSSANEDGKDTFDNQNGQTSTPDQMAQAILNYLAKRS